jgi:hypothetical protein
VEFSGVYEYKTTQGPMANEGEGSGIAIIEGETAIFKPEGSEKECQITFKFTGSKLVVTSAPKEPTRKFRLGSRSLDRIEIGLIARDHCCSHRFAAPRICPGYGLAVLGAW